ncbi:MAG: putative membrane protein OxaA [Parcubacteria group bacterium GW2011_GWB1_52_7]|nr:MAG: putative membrane protein OxaA [Parcubacteria group bacterium GW2011_GWA1_51_12]KKW29037.1 MAG: putative membrane protein OxaA [Parcubacteria group bacterium GW2011_GWB1_52_7]
MLALYNEIFYRPLINALIFLYGALPYDDLGLAIIALTIFIRLILYPFVAKSLRAQKALSELQPEISALQEKHKNNKEEQAKQLMELYRARGVNPLSGCLPALIQLPLLFALYHVFSNIAEPSALETLYGFVSRPETVNQIAFGFLDLAKPSIPLAIVAGVSQFLQGYLMPRHAAGTAGESQFAHAMQTQTIYFLPIVITVISFKFAAALPLYWTVLNIMGVLQQEGFFLRRSKKAVAK